MVGSSRTAEQSGLALRERQDPHPADSAPVSGWQHQDLQDHSGDLLQMQKIHETAQRIRGQVWGIRTYPDKKAKEQKGHRDGKLNEAVLGLS